MATEGLKQQIKLQTVFMEEVSTPKSIIGKTTLGSNNFSLIQQGDRKSVPLVL